ncbi:hypothetical protein [Anoxybacteroides tepidamans]|uniref:hypothetical protein n=1 Tax=Anoxybacteroides tepidamans TaxID=265948 RepID=UPI0012EC3F57|nr:hypothetical protein [Anoxybacillus tepidamans]
MTYDFTSSEWKKASPTAAEEIGAETPSGAQQKAEAAKQEAIQAAAEDATEKANQAEQNAKEAVENGQVNLPANKLIGAINTATNKIQASSQFYWEGGALIAVDPNNPNNVVKISSGGIGVSSDGGQTFRNAITGEGIVGTEIIAESLSSISANLGTVTAGILRAVTLDSATGTFSGSLKTQTLLIDSQSNQSHMIKMRMDVVGSIPHYAIFKGFTDPVAGTTLHVCEDLNGNEGAFDVIRLDTFLLDLGYGDLVTIGRIVTNSSVTAYGGLDVVDNVVSTSGRGWIAPTLLNGWVNNGSGFEIAGYYKDALGFIRLKGLIKGGTMGTTAFVLPAGYRPSSRRAFPVITSGGLGRVDIDTAGNVIVMSYGTASNGYVSLEGICFNT